MAHVDNPSPGIHHQHGRSELTRGMDVDGGARRAGGVNERDADSGR